MTESNVDRLISIGGNPLCNGAPEICENLVDLAGGLAGELIQLLIRKNGFFAFESALRVFPSRTTMYSIGLSDWNSQDNWRQDYKELADGCLFFAEDVFGGQFCIKKDQVCTFEPETGSAEPLADSLENWAQLVLDDFDYLTGYTVAHDWQVSHGQITSDCRLIPKLPFVCGGKYEIENLVAADAKKGMRSRANLARQILEIGDGGEISFSLID